MSERASNSALVVVDMLNPYDHEDAELLTGKVERDAVAHIHDHLADAAIEMMERNMDAGVAVAEECRFR